VKVLLVNPSSRGVFRTLSFALPPLGILYVAAALEKAGHTVRVVDRTVHPQDVDYGAFDVVGVHADTTRYARALDIARAARAAGATVVMGGPHPCFVAGEVLGSGAVDFIVKGEGERSLPLLLAALRDGGGWEEVPGLIFRKDGEVRRGPEPERIEDLDALPHPARHLIDPARYRGARMGDRPVMPVHTSRGCPAGCRFCSSTNFDGPRWRPRSAASVLDEVEHLVRDYGTRAVAFMDDNFARSPARLHRIAEGVLARGLDVHWWFFARVDTVVRFPELFRFLRRAGARSVFMGVESAAEGTLRSYDKGLRPGQAGEAVEILRSAGYEILASYILGAPFETASDVRETIRHACRLDTNTAQFTVLTPYPGTPLYEEVKDRIFDRDWSHYDSVHSVFRLDHLSRLELQLLLVRAYAAFYTRSRKSVYGFYRFLANRRFGLNALGEIVKSRVWA
jgi:anaerobic magnesium-protoporphyrin IX monomethyl ester cyclase